MSHDAKGRPEEQEAVRTTIVGGRPPGSGKSMGQVPRGIEVLLKKAAVDPDFRALLLEKRSAAAAEIGLGVTPAEKMMLDLAARSQLEGLIAGTRVDARIAPAFLGKAAAVMLAALGVVSLNGCGDEAKSWGIRPEDTPDGKQRAAATSRSASPESAGDQPGGPERVVEVLAVSLGIQPDRPATTRAADTVEVPPAVRQMSKGIQPDRPVTLPDTRPTTLIGAPKEDEPEIILGIRPARSEAIFGPRADRPVAGVTTARPPTTTAPTQPATQPENIKGVRADRPFSPGIAGVSPDLPPATAPTQPATRPASEVRRGLTIDRPAPMDDSDLRSQVVDGARPDRPIQTAEAVSRGIRPDRPTTEPAPPTTAPTQPATQPSEVNPQRGTQPDRPLRSEIVDGIRADRPVSKGMSSDRPATASPATAPSEPLSRGIRPDRPPTTAPTTT